MPLLANVFEQMAFMFADPADPMPIDGRALRVQMRFSGTRNGQLLMAVPETMACELAANLLGTDPGSPEALGQATDALGEMLNVLCGHVVTLLAGPDATTELTAPTIVNGTPEDWTAWCADPVTVSMSMDGHPVLLHLYCEEA